MHSKIYETALRRLGALDSHGGFGSLDTLQMLLEPSFLDPELRLVAALAMASVDMLTDEQFSEATRIAAAEAMMPLAVYQAWDKGNGDTADGFEAMERCREEARRLAAIVTRASSTKSEK